MVSQPHQNIEKTRHEKSRGLFRLFLGLVSLWLFAVVVAPWITSLKPLRPILTVIEENDINAAAFYYTELKEFSEADHMMRHYMTYPSEPDTQGSNPKAFGH